MSTSIRRRGGTTAEHSTFIGASRETTVDTTKNTVVVHDGVTPGGHPLAKASEIAGLAPSANPTFTGTPAAPTATPGTNTTQIATTAFVKAAADVLLGGVSATYDTLKEISDDLAGRWNAVVVHALSAKTTLADADEFGIIDSAASNVGKRTIWSDIKAGIWTALGALINAGTAKATPVDADMIALADSAASNATKKVTLTALWMAYLKAKADAIYMALVAPGTSGNVLTSNGTAWVSSAPAASGQPIPTSSTFAVGTMVIGACTAASTVDGGTVAGSIFFLVQLIQGNPGQVTSGGYVNYGTWKNVSGTTVPSNRHAYWVRVA